MDSLILQQDTPIILTMVISKLYIYLEKGGLFSTYNILINTLYLLYNEHNLNQIQSSL